MIQKIEQHTLITNQFLSTKYVFWTFVIITKLTLIVFAGKSCSSTASVSEWRKPSTIVLIERGMGTGRNMDVRKMCSIFVKANATKNNKRQTFNNSKNILITPDENLKIGSQIISLINYDAILLCLSSFILELILW